ncbi:hypothetical protein DQ04_02381080 [Trypanosoma grayi]|uniref:hypothetical protein n=1 Tax=Trypanosoma grayi TaxID=71804 RepID=UPI0004F42D8B|nr:hypothetical protein DQ04_02381080 [Trypanosoma grayi]KEG11673.1 hypothetical protein DQ04_02381080 [Trypanosoma grayi]
MVLPLAQLQFVQYVEQDENVSAIRVQPTKALVNCVCALSHAELIEEVPLAPVAGLLFVVAVEEEYEELVAILPSCDDLPRRFVIVPSAIATTNEGTAASTLNASSIKAQIEEAVSV